MHSVPDFALTLRQLAEKAEALAVTLTEPLTGNVTLQAALDRVQQVRPCQCIVMLHINLAGEARVSWRIWDGVSHHEGASLAGALNDFLTAHQPDNGRQLEDAGRIIDQADNAICAAALPF